MLNDLNGLSMAGGSTEERVVSGILAVLVVLCDLFLVNLWEHPVESICRAQPRTPFPLYTQARDLCTPVAGQTPAPPFSKPMENSEKTRPWRRNGC